MNESLAAEGGGDADVTVGGQQEMQSQVAESAAGMESQQETQIVQADYNQGYSEFQNAEEGEMAIAAGENPLGYAGAATNAENAAGSEANAIASEDTSWENALIGAAGTVGGAWAGR